MNSKELTMQQIWELVRITISINLKYLNLGSMIDTILMDKATFYEHLLKKDTDIKVLFESYESDDYIGLKRYISERVNEEYAFKDGDPEVNKDKPLLSEKANYRYSLFGLTMAEATTYNERDLEDAIRFLKIKK